MSAKLIALDDGHGMSTAGKRTPIFTDGTKSPETGKNFMHENEYNRAVVKYLKEELEYCGFKTLLVAPTDDDTSLQARVDLAERAKADAFVSVHANAATGSWGTANGLEVFTGSSATSKALGKNVLDNLLQGTVQRNRGLKDGMHLFVVRKTTMPAILIEGGFMDNAHEAKLLLSDAFRRECATEIAKGICATFKVAYKEKAPAVAKPETKPATETKKEEGTLKMTQQQFDVVAGVYQDAFKKGILTSDKWYKKAADKTLTMEEAIYINATLIGRILKK